MLIYDFNIYQLLNETWNFRLYTDLWDIIVDKEQKLGRLSVIDTGLVIQTLHSPQPLKM